MSFVTTDPAISSGLFSACRTCSTPPETIENSVGCPHVTITWNRRKDLQDIFRSTTFNISSEDHTLITKML